MTERIGYKLNPKKLVGAPQGILPFICGAFYYTEDFEYFDVIKPYLDIPEPHKSLEQIQQELEEKVNRTSKNSSSPPSGDPLNTPKQEKKRKSGLKRGGQPGHGGSPLRSVTRSPGTVDQRAGLYARSAAGANSDG